MIDSTTKDINASTTEASRSRMRYTPFVVCIVLVTLLISPFLWSIASDIVVESCLRRDLQLNGARDIKVRGCWATLGGNDSQVKAAAEVLSGYPHITAVFIYGNEMTDDAVPSISRITSIETLYIMNSPISDASLVALCGLRELNDLGLSGCKKISDDGIQHLSCLPKLAILGVGDGTQVTKAGVERLQRRNPSLLVNGL